MRSGPTPGKVFDLNQAECYIGRDVGNDIVVNDSEVSRKHARFIIQAGGYLLEDLGSTNGTFVNGQRLMGPHMLRPGEVIMFGENVSMAFESGYDPGATVVSTPVQPPAYTPPQPRQTYAPPPPVVASTRVTGPLDQQPQPPQPAYTGQIPPGPAEAYFEEQPEPRRPNTRTLVLAGCGCLIVALCVGVALLFAVDSMNMWCDPPFRWVSFLYPLIGGVACP
jgi:hypothetical protein